MEPFQSGKYTLCHESNWKLGPFTKSETCKLCFVTLLMNFINPNKHNTFDTSETSNSMELKANFRAW